MLSNIQLLEYLYDRFNARDIPAVLASLDADVMWANGMDGGHVHGHDSVRNYWTRQWAMIDPHVEPTAFSELADGAISVEVHQIVRDLQGGVLSDTAVGHVFRMMDGLVTRFDIR
jgi:hypothetical protein